MSRRVRQLTTRRPLLRSRVAGARPRPVPDFSADVTSGVANLTVTFTNLTTNSGLVTGWLWEYEVDGGGWDVFANGDETAETPSPQFLTAGTWSIRLTATYAGGEATETKIDYIEVSWRFYHTFTAANGTAVATLAADVSGLTGSTLSGTYVVQGNAAQGGTAGAGTVNMVVWESSRADLATIEAPFVIPGAGNRDCGIVFRVTDASNYWTALFENDDLTLYQFVAGVFTARGTYAAGATAGTTQTIKVVLSGTSISVYLGGVLRISYTSSLFQTNTKHGLRNYRDGTFVAVPASNLEMLP